MTRQPSIAKSARRVGRMMPGGWWKSNAYAVEDSGAFRPFSPLIAGERGAMAGRSDPVTAPAGGCGHARACPRVAGDRGGGWGAGRRGLGRARALADEASPAAVTP